MAIVETTTKTITCKNCGSEAVVRFGTYKGVQRYFCKVCKRKFKADTSSFGMKIPTPAISSAVTMYYEGMSIKAIRRQLQQDHQIMPSTATVWEWIQKYTQAAKATMSGNHPHVGDTWIADETYVRVDKSKANVKNPYSRSTKAKWLIFWDIIDADTRVLLASHITTTRSTRDAKVLMEKAAKFAGKTPKVVVTDNLAAYLDGIELAYGSDTTHKRGSPFEIENDNNLIERFHGTLKARTKVMRALKNRDSCEKFTDGWLIHYNYFRPHQALQDRTPAQVAGIAYQTKNWADVVNTSSPKTQTLIPDPVTVQLVHLAPVRPHVPRISQRMPRTSPKPVRLVTPHRARHGMGITRRADR